MEGGSEQQMRYSEEYCCYSSSDGGACKKHPRRSSSGSLNVGICAYCLRERLMKLVCSDCGEQKGLSFRSFSCSMSSNSSTSNSYRNSSCSTMVDVGSVGRISFLIENDPATTTQLEEPPPFLKLKRSNSCCVVEEIKNKKKKKKKKNGFFWRLLFPRIRGSRRREKTAAGGGGGSLFDDDVDTCMGHQHQHHEHRVYRSRSLCSLRGAGAGAGGDDDDGFIDLKLDVLSSKSEYYPVSVSVAEQKQVGITGNNGIGSGFGSCKRIATVLNGGGGRVINKYTSKLWKWKIFF